MIDKLLSEYADKFGAAFPVFSCECADEDELAEIIEDCIKANQPYEPECEKDIDY